MQRTGELTSVQKARLQLQLLLSGVASDQKRIRNSIDKIAKEYHNKSWVTKLDHACILCLKKNYFHLFGRLNNVVVHVTDNYINGIIGLVHILLVLNK